MIRSNKHNIYTKLLSRIKEDQVHSMIRDQTDTLSWYYYNTVPRDLKKINKRAVIAN